MSTADPADMPPYHEKPYGWMPRPLWQISPPTTTAMQIIHNVRRAVADEVEDALGDTERLPAEVAARMADPIGRLRTGRDL